LRRLAELSWPEAQLVIQRGAIALWPIGATEAHGPHLPLDTDVTDLIGTVALRIFLAIAMLSLDWVSLFEHIPMLLTAAAVQVVTTVIIAVLLVYTLFGRGREGAAATGGFIGFSLGAMPVGLAVMRRLNARFGDTPRALLAITLAAPYSPIRTCIGHQYLFPLAWQLTVAVRLFPSGARGSKLGGAPSGTSRPGRENARLQQQASRRRPCFQHCGGLPYRPLFSP